MHDVQAAMRQRFPLMKKTEDGHSVQFMPTDQFIDYYVRYFSPENEALTRQRNMSLGYEWNTQQGRMPDDRLAFIDLRLGQLNGKPLIALNIWSNLAGVLQELENKRKHEAIQKDIFK